jgi:hypothetical protein
MRHSHIAGRCSIEAHARVRAIPRQLAQSRVAMAAGPRHDCWSSSDSAASGRAQRCAGLLLCQEAEVSPALLVVVQPITDLGRDQVSA